MTLMVATVLSFGAVTLWLFQRGLQNLRWTLDDEMSRARHMIQKGYRKAMTEHLVRAAIVSVLVVIGASGMTFRYFWWLIAALLFLLSAVGFTISKFVSYKDVKTDVIPEEDELERRVRLRRGVGVGLLVVGLAWLASGTTYMAG